MTLRLPQTIGDGRVDIFLKWIVLTKQHGSGLKLKLDWSKVSSISPAGFAILACLFDTFIEQKAQVSNIHVPKKLKEFPAVNHMIHLGRFSALPPATIQNYENSMSLLAGRHNAIDPLFSERLQEKFSPYLSEGLLYAAVLTLNELMQNSVDHATSERYYLYAGLWNNEFHTGCLDMGITIPAKLEQKYVCNNDLEYLELALQKGTGTRRMRTGGFGLYYFFEFLKESGGKLTIVSRGAQIRRYFKTRKSQKNILKYRLPGTWCFARFPLEGSQ